MTPTLYRPAVFLDRDGVINEVVLKDGKPYPPESFEALTIAPEAYSVLYRLHKAGFILIGITNQPDVARGTQRREIVEEINSKLIKVLPIEEILVCYHDDQDRCDCRKPKPGLILTAAEKYNIDLSASFMVGDRWKDITAGENAGCRTIFIDHNYQEPKPNPPADFTTRNLEGILQYILSFQEYFDEVVDGAKD